MMRSITDDELILPLQALAARHQRALELELRQADLRDADWRQGPSLQVPRTRLGTWSETEGSSLEHFPCLSAVAHRLRSGPSTSSSISFLETTTGKIKAEHLDQEAHDEVA